MSPIDAKPIPKPECPSADSGESAVRDEPCRVARTPGDGRGRDASTAKPPIRSCVSLAAGARWLLLLVLLPAMGCAREELDTVYGRRRGSPGEVSVNGTAVLAAMFERAGHRVISWRRLSPKLNECQTIVWFPDDFASPTEAQREFLENWLSDQPGRTLIYVGRDYDAAITYWQTIQPTAPAVQANEVARRLALAQATLARRRAAMPIGESCNWFVVRDGPRHRATSLTGAWAQGIDASKAEVEIRGWFDVPSPKETALWTDDYGYPWPAPPRCERMLVSQGDALVTRMSWDEDSGSQLFYIANGSFLLNLPLVNHQHRKLAQRLIAACGSPGRIAFLESDSSGLAVYDKEPSAHAPTGFEVFTVWPIGVILVHLTALGFLACIALFPVFGRPRELPSRGNVDFGQHVEALGEMLEQTQDREYALQRLRAYHEMMRRPIGSSSKRKRP